jgi:glutathione synthase/RimK-type ligase-like ATP-grasp enzyme
MRQLIVIGIEDPLLERLRGRIDANFTVYPNVPRILSHGGQTYVESARIMNHWLKPDGIIYHGYYFNDHVPAARRALALSDTPTFPDVRRTLPHDDRAVSLAMAMAADRPRKLDVVRRGFIPKGEDFGLKDRVVVKEGAVHCGEGVSLLDFREGGNGDVLRGTFEGIVEPFFEGRSERILIIGGHFYHLRYESEDWRKNVRTTKVLKLANDFTPDLIERTSALLQRLDLQIAGVDFLMHGDTAHLLEVNAYPGLDDVPEALDAWANAAYQWWATKVEPRTP